jgi:hypothetical protein
LIVNRGANVPPAGQAPNADDIARLEQYVSAGVPFQRLLYCDIGVVHQHLLTVLNNIAGRQKIPATAPVIATDEAIWAAAIKFFQACEPTPFSGTMIESPGLMRTFRIPPPLNKL